MVEEYINKQVKNQKRQDNFNKPIMESIMNHELFELMAGRVKIKDLPKETRKKYNLDKAVSQ